MLLLYAELRCPRGPGLAAAGVDGSVDGCASRPASVVAFSRSKKTPAPARRLPPPPPFNLVKVVWFVYLCKTVSRVTVKSLVRLFRLFRGLFKAVSWENATGRGIDHRFAEMCKFTILLNFTKWFFSVNLFKTV